MKTLHFKLLYSERARLRSDLYFLFTYLGKLLGLVLDQHKGTLSIRWPSANPFLLAKQKKANSASD